MIECQSVIYALINRISYREVYVIWNLYAHEYAYEFDLEIDNMFLVVLDSIIIKYKIYVHSVINMNPFMLCARY